MPRYLLSIYQPDGPPPPPEILDPIMRELGAVNAEMEAAGARVLAVGLHPPDKAKVLQHREGRTLMTDGPFVEAKEHIGGFTIVEAPDLDAALEWGGKLARALHPLSIEVRQMHQGDSTPDPAPGA